MSRWTDQTSFPLLSAPAAEDLLPVADMSEADGSRQRTITWGQLVALAQAGATIAAVDPTAGDDTADGYSVGSLWFNSVSGDLFIATDVAAAAAVWATVLDASAGIGAGDDADLLGSGTATDGWVLTADGVGGAAWEAVAGGTGDVTGPASVVDDNVATFDGATGKLIQDGGTTVAKLRLQSFIIACSDETTALTTGTAKATFRMPYAFTLTAVRASVTTAPTGSVLTVDINEGITSILSTKLTIDAASKTSVGATTPAVISDTALADDAEITVDIDGVGSTVAGAGLKVTLIGYAT